MFRVCVCEWERSNVVLNDLTRVANKSTNLKKTAELLSLKVYPLSSFYKNAGGD